MPGELQELDYRDPQDQGVYVGRQDPADQEVAVALAPQALKGHKGRQVLRVGMV